MAERSRESERGREEGREQSRAKQGRAGQGRAGEEEDGLCLCGVGWSVGVLSLCLWGLSEALSARGQ